MRKKKGYYAKTEAFQKAQPLLGTMPDKEVSKLCGCSEGSVYAWRKEAGIPAMSRKRWKSPETSYEFALPILGVWSEEQISDLLKERGYNVSPWTIQSWRKRIISTGS